MSDIVPVAVGEVRVAVVDRRRLVREGVATLLADAPHLAVLAVLSALPAASSDGLDAVSDAHVVVLGPSAAVPVGSFATVLLRPDHTATSLVEDVCSAVRVAPAGTDPQLPEWTVVSKMAGAAGMGGVAGPAESVAALSEREISILTAVGAGRSAAQIGDSLGLSTRTVEAAKQSILIKLDVQSQAQAIARARRAGIL